MCAISSLRVVGEREREKEKERNVRCYRKCLPGRIIVIIIIIYVIIIITIVTIDMFIDRMDRISQVICVVLVGIREWRRISGMNSRNLVAIRIAVVGHAVVRTMVG